MKKENPFDQKMVERQLFAAYKNGMGRRARTFLRRMARDICHGWEIGYRDGLAGKPLILRDELPQADSNPMRRGIFDRTYAAYSCGHRAGTQERGSDLGCIRA